MKNIKIWIIFFISILLIFIISINIYIYNTHNTLNSTVNELSQMKTELTDLDTFKTNIINLENSQKYYILTNEENYKSTYTQDLSTAINSINDLAKNNILSSTEQNNLLNLLKEYDSINQQLATSGISTSLTDSQKSLLDKSNNIESQILSAISSSISSNTNNTTTTHSTLSSSVTNEKNVLQGISSAFALIISGPICYIFKKFKNGNIKFSDITTTLEKEKEKLLNYIDMARYNSMLNTHNKQMQKEWQDVQVLVDNLQQSINDLKVKIEEAETAPTQDALKGINDIEIKLLEIKISVKELPNYHDFVIGLTDNYLSNNKQ